jgi:hypothetical protein
LINSSIALAAASLRERAMTGTRRTFPDASEVMTLQTLSVTKRLYHDIRRVFAFRVEPCFVPDRRYQLAEIQLGEHLTTDERPFGHYSVFRRRRHPHFQRGSGLAKGINSLAI